MILNYSKFFESVKDVRDYDRVITHGGLRYWGDDGEYTVDLEGQTGRVASSVGGGYRYIGVVFDNYFFPKLTSLDGKIKMNRGLWVPLAQIEKVPLELGREKFPMMFSPNAKKVFDRCEFVDGLDRGNINYVDLTDKNDTISYMTNDRLARLGFDDDQWKNNLRQEMKVGKFIMMINPKTDQRSLEKKVNLFKAAYNGIIANKSEFKLVKGQEIIDWYNEDRYQDGTGSLNKSCMRDKMDRLNIYADNPNKVSLLILVNEDNKLVGRALVWELDDPISTYMDRVYTVYQEDVFRFEDYARKNSWRTYEVDRYGEMVVKLDHMRSLYPEDNPYMDTFSFYYIEGKYGEGYLSNKYHDEDNDPPFEFDYVG